MMRRLGRRWRRLHRLVYPIALLAIVHFFIQAKADVYEPTVMAGLLAWLLGARAIARLSRRRTMALWAVAALGLAAGAATALGEALYFHLRTGVAMARVLQANLSPYVGLRPAAVVLLIAGAVTLAAALVRLLRRAVRPVSAAAA
jgi:sulfoxide reductase heme-binding subunit YedZ